MSQTYQKLLTQLAEEVGLEGAALLASEEIVIDELPIGLQLEGEDEEAEVWLCSLLAAPSIDRWEEVARTLPHANHLWTGTGGATLGMLPEDNTVSLNVRRPLRDLDAEKLAVVLAKMADIGRAWQDFIASGFSPSEVPPFLGTAAGSRA